MKIRHRILLISVLAIAVLLFAACTGPQGPPGPVGPAGATGPLGPAGPPGLDATADQEYVGSDQCGECHESQYETFVLSGHPNELTKIEGGQPPVFPYDSITGGVPGPPEGYSWGDISYVIGGYGWKALFIDNDGYIITGSGDAATQYNYANENVGADAGWVPYHAGEEMPYDCGTCHTTGYSPQGRQDDLEGIIGTWAFPGIQCEECHGPGSRHVANPPGVEMVVDRSSQACGACHSRGNPAQIDAVDGFEEHYQQYSDLYNSKHLAISCVACHDPHASKMFAAPEEESMEVVSRTCEGCHWQKEDLQKQRFHVNLNVDCVDCHMPKIAKSAQGNLETFTADIRSHQFSINPDPEAPQFNEEGTQVMPWLTLQYACGHCHNGEVFSEQTLEDLSETATGYHDRPTPIPPTLTPAPTATPEPTPEATPEPTATPEG